MKKLSRFTLLAMMIMSLGCEAKHLVYVQEVSLGLIVSVGTEGSQKISLAYDRDVFAIVPKKGEGEDAMSLLSINRAKVDGLAAFQVNEFVATGSPADSIATDSEAVAKIRSKIYGR